MEKQCRICGSVAHHNWRNKKKEILQSKCIKCTSEYQKQFYISNREHYLNKTSIRRKIRFIENTQYVCEFLEEHPCVDCGEDDIVVLEFDHVRGNKEKEISLLIQDSASLETLKLEIEKCDIRCANCHKRKTAKQYGWFKFKRSRSSTG